MEHLEATHLSPGTSVLAMACASSESGGHEQTLVDEAPEHEEGRRRAVSRGIDTLASVPKAITASTIVVGDRKLSSSAAVRASTMLDGVRERGRVMA